MRFCTCCVVGAPGVCCPMSFPSGKPSITTFAGGRGKESGIASCTPYACGCAPSKAEILSRVRPSSIANQSKPARCAALKRAMIWGKKTWGRKRHALVDTQGNLLAVKVTGAEKSDHQGGRILLSPLKRMLPRLKLVWGDSHYGGAVLTFGQKTFCRTIPHPHSPPLPQTPPL